MAESVIDTARPNPGRVCDYLLGGYHNYEIDRRSLPRERK
jgi:S-adenosyl methyltransferase